MLKIRRFIFPSILSLLFIHPLAYTAHCSYKHIAQYPDVKYVPWFTGPLLSPTPVNMVPGHPAIEPSIVVGSNYGRYKDNWKYTSQDSEWFVNPFLDYQLGITDRIGLEMLVSFISNFKKNTASTRMQDSSILLGFQIANDAKGTWIPDIRLDLQATLPTGNYQKLSPSKLGTDLTGQGAYQTGPLLIVHKMFYPGDHFLALKISVGYLFPTNVKVKGLNAYGGNPSTRGTVHPGQTLTTFFSGEYSISQRWGWGFDTLFTYQKKSTFTGSTDKNAPVGLPPSAQLSLAPYLEYNFTQRMGVLGGVWCTLAGRNTTAFASGYFAFIYTF